MNVADLIDPFLSQVPIGFNTGLIKQFAPMINSTATVDHDVDGSGFPKNCQSEKNSFYVAFNYSVGDPRVQGYMEFSMEACMPGDQTQPKWNATRSRQDFSEELYLKILTHSATVDSGLGNTSYRISVDTTAGFFELPNYAHTEAGPLLENGPLALCGEDCERQVPTEIRKRQVTTNTSTMLGLESVPNKGPLLTIALALFGESSFIADRFYNWDSYIIPRTTWKISQTPYHCQEMVPFTGLMTDPDTGLVSLSGNNGIINCASNTFLFDKAAVYRQIFDYLQFFQVEPSVLSNAFTAAAYLANEAWLLHPSGLPSGLCSLRISLDHGTESHKPHISLAGIITISLLLAVFLLSLLAMSLYSSFTPRWTTQLNTFAMIRIGASISDQVSLKYVNNVDDIRSIDKISGTMGGEASTVDGVDDLRLGALQPLSRDNRYSSMDRIISQDERFAMVRNHSIYYDAEEGRLRERAQ